MLLSTDQHVEFPPWGKSAFASELAYATPTLWQSLAQEAAKASPKASVRFSAMSLGTPGSLSRPLCRCLCIRRGGRSLLLAKVSGFCPPLTVPLCYRLQVCACFIHPGKGASIILLGAAGHDGQASAGGGIKARQMVRLAWILQLSWIGIWRYKLTERSLDNQLH